MDIDKLEAVYNEILNEQYKLQDENYYCLVLTSSEYKQPLADRLKKWYDIKQITPFGFYGEEGSAIIIEDVSTGEDLRNFGGLEITTVVLDTRSVQNKDRLYSYTIPYLRSRLRSESRYSCKMVIL